MNLSLPGGIGWVLALVVLIVVIVATLVTGGLSPLLIAVCLGLLALARLIP